MTSKSVHGNNVLTQLVLRNKILNWRTGFLYFAFVLIYSLLESTFKIKRFFIYLGFLLQAVDYILLTVIMFHFYPGLSVFFRSSFQNFSLVKFTITETDARLTQLTPLSKSTNFYQS